MTLSVWHVFGRMAKPAITKRIFARLWMLLEDELVGDARLELAAYGFGGQRSIHLS